MPTIDLPYNWAPRDYQLPLWRYLRNGGTRAVAVWHRRAGKDDVALHNCAIAAHERIGNYWHMLPQYEQCRKAIWEAVNPHTGIRRIDEAFPAALRRKTYKQRMLIEFKCGSTWQLVGSDNYDGYLGSPPIGVTFSEYALADPLAWAYIRPILVENKGWAVFIYTARGDNHGHRTFNMAKESMDVDGIWFADFLTAADTSVFERPQLDIELRELIAEFGSDEGQAIFDQEYFNSFRGAMPGAYYSKVINEAKYEGRIGFVPYKPGYKVYTFWDLGSDDSTTIWFMQHIGNAFNFIDYHEDRRKGMEDYAKVLQDKPYIYGDHYMPHDAMNTSVQTNKTTQEYAEDLGIEPIIVIEKPNDSQAVIAGINAGRRVFGQCFFDERKCENGLSALTNYRSQYDDKKRKPGNYPVKDWCLTGDTELITDSGLRQIQNMADTGRIKTLCGWMDYINPRITKRNAQLVEVRFTDGYTVRCTPDHLFLTENGWSYAKSLRKSSLIQSCLIPSPSILVDVSTGCSQPTGTSSSGGDTCIKMYRNLLLGMFHRVATSTIGTGELLIIALRTLSVLMQQSIFPEIGLKNVLGELCGSQRRLGSGLRIGINPSKVDYGIADMLLKLRGGRNGAGNQKSVPMLSAANHSWPLSGRTEGESRDSVRCGAPMLTIESVVEQKETADVWCITVPGAHTYALANGAVVHNSGHAADGFRLFATGYSQRARVESVTQTMERLGLRVA